MVYSQNMPPPPPMSQIGGMPPALTQLSPIPVNLPASSEISQAESQLKLATGGMCISSFSLYLLFVLGKLVAGSKAFVGPKGM